MKKTIWIIIIIVIIVIGIICGMQLNKAKPVNNQDVEENNKEENKMINEEISNILNQVDEQTNTQEEKTQVNNSSETFTQEPATEEEKAIRIVQKDYGIVNDTKFSIEGMDESGRQIVVVRNSTTTEALAFYFVNVSNSTFTKKEMN